MNKKYLFGFACLIAGSVIAKRNVIIVNGNIDVSTVNNLNSSEQSKKDIQELPIPVEKKDELPKPTILIKKREKIAEWFVGQSKDKLSFKEWMDWLKNAALIGILYAIVIYPINTYVSPSYDVANWWVRAAQIGIGLLTFGSVMQLACLFVLNIDSINDAKGISPRIKIACQVIALIIFIAVFAGLSFASVFYVKNYIPNSGHVIKATP